MAERIVLLHAPSGAGKSSLLQAGLLPQMEKEQRYQVLPVIRVSRLPESHAGLPEKHNRYLLGTMLSLETAFDEANLASMSLVEYLDTRWPFDPSRQDQVLVFDQFEEIFSLEVYDRDEKLAFFQQLGDALANPNRRALFVMRDDYLGALEPYLYLVPTYLRARFRLDFLSPKAALEAVCRPTEAAGVTFEEEAARGLVHDLSMVQTRTPDGAYVTVEGPYVEPVQLQVVCQRLWARLVETGRLHNRIDARDVHDFGRVSDALAGFYRETVAAAARRTLVPEARIRSWIEKKLIVPPNLRNRLLRRPEETAGMPDRVVAQLLNLLLLRQEEHRNAVWVELTHDQLVDPVLKDNHRAREARIYQMGRMAAITAIVLTLVLLGANAVSNLQKSQIARTATYQAVQQVQLEQGFQQTSVYQQQQQTQAVGAVSSDQAAAVQLVVQQAEQDISIVQATATQAAMALLPLEDLKTKILSSDPAERASAARALGLAVGSRPELVSDAATLLSGRLDGKVENDPKVRVAAVDSLLQVATVEPKVVLPMIGFFAQVAGDPEPGVRAGVASLLGVLGSTIGDSEMRALNQEILTRLSRDQNPDVRDAAEVSLSRLAELTIKSYARYWVNVDPAGGWAHIEARAEGKRLVFHFFGRCVPTECDAGEAVVDYDPAGMTFRLDSSFAERTIHLWLEMNTGLLRVETATHFIDNSGRADYTLADRFSPGKPMPLATAAPTPGGMVIPVTGGGPVNRLFIALFWSNDGLAGMDLDVGGGPFFLSFPGINARYVAVNLQHNEAYVSFTNGDRFYAIDALTWQIAWQIREEVGWNSRNMVVSPDGAWVYLATSGGDKNPENKILVIDTTKRQVSRVIRLGPYQYPDSTSRIVLTPDGARLYVIDRTAGEWLEVDALSGEVVRRERVAWEDLLGMSARSDALYVYSRNFVRKVDLMSLNELWRVPVRGAVESIALAGSRVYLADRFGGQILVVDETSGMVMTTWDIPTPVEVALAPNGRELYASSIDKNVVFVVDLDTGLPSWDISLPSGSGPTGLAVLKPEE